MKVTPIKDMVLIRLEEFEEIIGNIIVPSTVKNKQIIGIIVAIGEGSALNKLFKKGDKVITTQYTGTPWIINNKPHLLIPDTEIIAKLED